MTDPDRVTCPRCNGNGNGQHDNGYWKEEPAEPIEDATAGAVMEGMRTRFACVTCRGTGLVPRALAAAELLTEDEPLRMVTVSVCSGLDSRGDPDRLMRAFTEAIEPEEPDR